MTETTTHSYTIRQVATLMSKSVDTIKAWHREGKFPNAYRGGPRDNDPWMIPVSDLAALEINNTKADAPPGGVFSEDSRTPLPTHDDPIGELKDELARERERRLVAEARLEERDRALNLFEMAFKTLPVGETPQSSRRKLFRR